MSIVAISCESKHLIPKAKYLAKKLRLPITNTYDTDYLILLVITKEHIELRQTNTKTKPLYVDFLSPQLNYRKKYGGGQKQLLAKAIGIKSSYKPSVIDATAGFGIDAYVLATLGCKVQMLERSPIIGALLGNGLKRAKNNPEFVKLKLSLKIIDAIKYLAKLSKAQQPDVIYLDPMFPDRIKSALNKKTMRILHEIVEKNLDGDKLFNISLKSAHKRVVVKRPKLAPYLGNKKPDVIYRGKSCRFDVYFISSCS